MTLLTSSAFSTFDQSTNVNRLDISPFLSKALIFDFHALGTFGMPLDNPLIDTTYTWFEDGLNGDTLTPTISVSTSDTSLTITASTAPHVGDYVYVQTKTVPDNTREVMQITAVNSSTNVSVSRGFNSTAASIATTSTLALMRNEQEFSDISSDASVNPTGRVNYTSIIPGRDLQFSGSQLERVMTTTAMADQVAHQLENRLIEWRRNATRALLYSEKIGPGSDTQYRSFGGIRYWIENASGQTETTAATLTITHLNTVNKLIVDQGVYPDTLVIGTDLVGSINAIDASNRRLLESDSRVGYMVNYVTLGQGNAVQVVVDNRVNAGDFFLVPKEKVTFRPYGKRGLFTIAGSDWVDGVKRRILGEWGLEVRNASTMAYGSSKS